MIPLGEICCLYYELKEPFKIDGDLKQFLGCAALQFIPRPFVCKYQFVCPFFQKHNRCPTGEEIIAKYHKSTENELDNNL